MERFKITAVDPRSGKFIEGFLDGLSADAVRRMAEERGLRVLTVELMEGALTVPPETPVAPATLKAEDTTRERPAHGMASPMAAQPLTSPPPIPPKINAPALVYQPSSATMVPEASASTSRNFLSSHKFLYAPNEHRKKRKKLSFFPALPDPAIPITPMLDMTFQLLFFFIMTFRPPAGEETEIPFSLPPMDDKQASVQSKDPPPFVDQPPKFEANLTLVLLANGDGDLRKLELTGGGFSETIEIPESDIRSPEKVVALVRVELKRKLRLPFLAHFGENIAQARNRDVINIRLQAVSGVKWEMVSSVIDSCRSVARLISDDPSKAVIALQSPIDQQRR